MQQAHFQKKLNEPVLMNPFLLKFAGQIFTRNFYQNLFQNVKKASKLNVVLAHKNMSPQRKVLC